MICLSKNGVSQFGLRIYCNANPQKPDSSSSIEPNATPRRRCEFSVDRQATSGIFLLCVPFRNKYALLYVIVWVVCFHNINTLLNGIGSHDDETKNKIKIAQSPTCWEYRAGAMRIWRIHKSLYTWCRNKIAFCGYQ